MKFNSEELKHVILGVESRIVLYEKLYFQKVQIAEEKGWSTALKSEIAYISGKIADLTRLKMKLYNYKFNKK